MLRLNRISLGLGVFFATAAWNGLGAQPNLSSGSFLIHPWVVGQSISLQTKSFVNGDLNHTETVTYSIVDQEKVGGKDYFWVEIERVENNSITLTQKLQVRQPESMNFEDVLDSGLEHGITNLSSFFKPRRLIQQVNMGKTRKFSATNEFEIPSDTVSQVEEGPAPSAKKDLDGRYSVTDWQSVHVAAGTFKSTHFTQTDFSSASRPVSATASTDKTSTSSISNESWASLDVPILGLVKKTIQFQDSDGISHSQQTELISYHETGAASKIAGTPVPVSLKYRKKVFENLEKSHPEKFSTQDDQL